MGFFAKYASAAGAAGGTAGVSLVNSLSGALTLAAGDNIDISDNGVGTITIAVTDVITSVNSLTGALVLAAGTNITLTPVGNTITISASGGGGGGGLQPDGSIPMDNDAWFTARNSTDDADIKLFELDSTNILKIGTDAAVTSMQIGAGDAEANAAIYLDPTSMVLVGGAATFFGDGNIQIYSTSIELYAKGDASGAATINLYDGASNNSVNLCAPAAVTTTYTLKFPVDGGTAGQMLSTDGTGQLSFVNTVPAFAAAPAGTSAGQLYFDTILGKLRVYNGAGWETITSV